MKLRNTVIALGLSLLKVSKPIIVGLTALLLLEVQ